MALDEWQKEFLEELSATRGEPWRIIRNEEMDRSYLRLETGDGMGNCPLEVLKDSDLVKFKSRAKIVVNAADKRGRDQNTMEFRKAMLEVLNLEEP